MKETRNQDRIFRKDDRCSSSPAYQSLDQSLEGCGYLVGREGSQYPDSYRERNLKSVTPRKLGNCRSNMKEQYDTWKISALFPRWCRPSQVGQITMLLQIILLSGFRLRAQLWCHFMGAQYWRTCWRSSPIRYRGGTGCFLKHTLECNKQAFERDRSVSKLKETALEEEVKKGIKSCYWYRIS